MYIKLVLVLFLSILVGCSDSVENNKELVYSTNFKENQNPIDDELYDLFDDLASIESKNEWNLNIDEKIFEVLTPNIQIEWIDNFYVSDIDYPSWDFNFSFREIDKNDVALWSFQIYGWADSSDWIEKIEVQHIIFNEDWTEKINDSYFLQQYEKWDSSFEYNPSIEREVLINWKNKYKFIWYIDDEIQNRWEISFTVNNFASPFHVENLWITSIYPRKWGDFQQNNSIDYNSFVSDAKFWSFIDNITFETQSNSLYVFEELMDFKTDNIIDFENLCSIQHRNYIPNSRKDQQPDLLLSGNRMYVSSTFFVQSDTQNWNYNFINCELQNKWIMAIFKVSKSRASRKIEISPIFVIQHSNNQFSPYRVSYNNALSIFSESYKHMTIEDTQKAYKAINNFINEDINYKELYSFIANVKTQDNYTNDVDSFLENFDDTVYVDAIDYTYEKYPAMPEIGSFLNYKNISDEKCLDFNPYSEVCTDEMKLSLKNEFLYEKNLIDISSQGRIECWTEEFLRSVTLCEIKEINNKKFLVTYRWYLYGAWKSYITFYWDKRFIFRWPGHVETGLKYDEENNFLLKKTLEKLKDDPSYDSILSKEDLEKEWLLARWWKSPIVHIYLKAYEDLPYYRLIEDAISTIKFK